MAKKATTLPRPTRPNGGEMLDRLVVRLEARGLAIDPTVQFWPGDKAAAKVLGVWCQNSLCRFCEVRRMCSLRLCETELELIGLVSSSNVLAVNKQQLGWKPVLEHGAAVGKHR